MSFRILAVGEVLWDMLPGGKLVGGAPGNFAYHCLQLGADAQMFSRVGNDELGRELLDFYRSKNIPTGHFSVDPERPTGTVDVALDAGGQPKYTICENVAWDHLAAEKKTFDLAATLDAICFGSLACRSAQSYQTICQLVRATPESALRVFDVNLRSPFYSASLLADLFPLANVLKLNDDEIKIIARMFGGPNDSLQKQAEWLLETYQYKLLILTLGANGSLLMTPGQISEYRNKPVQVVDTVGAGDAFTAGAVFGFLSGWPLDKINACAGDLAAYVCTQRGAMP